MAPRDDVTRGGLAAIGTARAACCREDFEKFGLVVCSMEGDAFIPRCFLQRCYCPVGNVCRGLTAGRPGWSVVALGPAACVD